MELEIVDKVLIDSIGLLERAHSGIRQCLPHYEKRCYELIVEIGKCQTATEAQKEFDALYEIQGKLATLLFKHNFDIGSKLESLTVKFDRLHDPYIRDYWHGKFRSGEVWPDSA